nr:radical SAM protein [Yersinia enterocolitica]
METLLRDLPFYRRSGGGVTLSGGEPFSSRKWRLNYCSAVTSKESIPRLNLVCIPRGAILPPALPWLDLMLADLKHTDEQRFQQWTGGSAKRVMDNFRKLAAAGTNITVRVPLIPDFNADRCSVQGIVDFAADEIGVKEIHFLPYHTLGINKYSLLGEEFWQPRHL